MPEIADESLFIFDKTNPALEQTTMLFILFVLAEHTFLLCKHVSILGNGWLMYNSMTKL